MAAPILLATDACLFALLATGVAYWAIARRHEHLRAPWREVWARPAAAGAAVVLAVFLAVALVDSVHFEARGEEEGDVVSLLDLALAPLRLHGETSYSAPFATHAYARETVRTADGSLRREFPRLAHGGSHLADPALRGRDLARRIAAGVALGLALFALPLSLALARERRAYGGVRAALAAIAAGRTRRPWRSLLSATAVLAVLLGLGIALAPAYHVLGTDKVGTDVLYQALKSVRTGILIGSLTTLLSLPFALVLGVTAGYYRGPVDDAVQYLYTTLSSIPGVLLIAAAALMLDVHMSRHAESFDSLAARADLRLLALCGILGITSWTSLCRLLRAEALKLREIEYVAAAQALGARSPAIIRRHLLPNVMHIVMITTVLDFSSLVLAEAALTYIDIGVDPSMESWGNMINAARLELAREPAVWWSLVAALAFMFTLVLAANLFADAVRDAFDPRLRRFGVDAAGIEESPAR